MDIYIVGVGMTPFGRFPEWGVKDLAQRAVTDALTDAGCGKSAVDAAFFANTVMGYLENQIFIPGPIALRAMGFEEIPILTVENACASGSTALWEAINFVRSGSGDVALAVGAEKMNVGDKQRQLAIFDSGWEIETADENYAELIAYGAGVDVPPGSESPDARSRFMDVYAAYARRHMREYGVTQRQIAAVSAKNHAHSVHNPRAFFHKEFSIDDVLAAKPVVYPLTVPMCAPVTDGGAAAIVCSEEAMARYGFDRSRAVKVEACVLVSAVPRQAEEVENQPTYLAARRAYDQAGIGPEDIDVAEVHDAAAIGEIREIENLGLCGFGEAAALSERGDTSIGGRIPVNPSGGLESKGHPIAATGLGQIFELTAQLRGECDDRQVDNARYAIQENGGGSIGLDAAVTVVSILSRTGSGR
ncbi:thiolase family protein [Nocardia australiensis]|uniref:thiolase family protein n=1 Tax=Nocardia australiensis TaxID=2887191 RepID=UPI001D15157F|nr:thiolase family protein [Nocardia australiensis]